jgi:hypothetical protein
MIAMMGVNNKIGIVMAVEHPHGAGLAHRVKKYECRLQAT